MGQRRESHRGQARRPNAHDVVVVTGEDGDAGAALPVPDADGLVVGGGDDPGLLRVEVDGADIVEVAVEGEEASTVLVVPDLDLVVVSAGDEEGLGRVEVDSAYGSVVFLEAVYEDAHLKVPQLDRARVERRGEEGQPRVERDPLDAVRPRLELGEHLHLGVRAPRLWRCLLGAVRRCEASEARRPTRRRRRGGRVGARSGARGRRQELRAGRRRLGRTLRAPARLAVRVSALSSEVWSEGVRVEVCVPSPPTGPGSASKSTRQVLRPQHSRPAQRSAQRDDCACPLLLLCVPSPSAPSLAVR